MALAPGKSGAHLPVAGSLMWRVYLSTRATCRLPSFAPCLGARACLGPPTSPVFGPLTRPRGTVSTPRGYAWAGRDGTQAPNCPGNRARGGTWLRFPLAAVWPALDVCGGDAPGVQAQYNLRLDLFDLSPALLQRQVLGRQRMLAPAPFPAAWCLHSRADLVAAHDPTPRVIYRLQCRVALEACHRLGLVVALASLHFAPCDALCRHPAPMDVRPRHTARDRPGHIAVKDQTASFGIPSQKTRPSSFQEEPTDP